jgi:hypothetical protein
VHGVSLQHTTAHVWIHNNRNHASVSFCCAVTVAQALAASPAIARVSYARGANIQDSNESDIPVAVATAAAADAIVLVLGDSGSSAGESHDRDSLDLPGAQLQLLAAIGALGKPLTLVLVNGRTVTFGGAGGNSVLSNVSAVLVAWRPGQEGGAAIAGELVPPSGNSRQETSLERNYHCSTRCSTQLAALT